MARKHHVNRPFSLPELQKGSENRKKNLLYLGEGREVQALGLG